MVCTKHLGTVSTVAPTGTGPVPGTGTGPACTGDCFFFSRWLAEFTLKQVPLPK
eukprot:SAG31_NODE_2178_length_6250_cov_2.498456_1_plen_53_part_10